MQRPLVPLILALIVCCCRLAGAQTYAIRYTPDAAEAPEPVATLAGFGVDEKSPVAIARFLSDGIADSVRQKPMPGEPRLRLQLMPLAMQRAVELNAELARAPLMRLAQKDFSLGVMRMLREDERNAPTADREALRQRLERDILAYNAANALSLMGETAAIPHIERMLATEERATARAQLAMAIISLGEAEPMDLLLRLAATPERASSYFALRALEDATGQDFSAEPQAPKARREASAKKALAWWEQNRKGWRADPVAIRARRAQPEPPRPVPVNPVTMRDHLLWAGVLSKDGPGALTDAQANPDQPRASRRYLGSLGAERAKALAVVAEDVGEDLDLRLEAMRWMVQNKPSDKDAVLKRLKRSDDPEIVAAAVALLEK